MRPFNHTALLAVVVAVAACADAPTGPGTTNQVRLTGDGVLSHGEAHQPVIMTDDCEPTSFNAVLGAGTCIGSGNTTFAEFIAELQETQEARRWRNLPPRFTSHAGTTLQVLNRGGEVHTFTPVAAFGGGFVPDLNGISGNPVPAPECLNFGSMVFIPAGGVDEVTVGGAAVQRYQCCIHPWMRSTVRVN